MGFLGAVLRDFVQTPDAKEILFKEITGSSAKTGKAFKPCKLGALAPDGPQLAQAEFSGCGGESLSVQ